MKRVEGTPWSKVLSSKSLAENLEILMKVADAIAFAHARGVMHRDIKPENTMLGDFGEVLVMDWGLALSTAAFRKAGSISQTSSMGGTPAYMAPEMAAGPLERIGPASDIYLLGAVLFEIITGRQPHTGKNVMKCLLAAAHNEIVPVEQSGRVDFDCAAGHGHQPGRSLCQRARLSDRDSRVPIAFGKHRVGGPGRGRPGSGRKHGRLPDFFPRDVRFSGVDRPVGRQRAARRRAFRPSALAYARQALAKADYDLGLSLLDANNPEHACAAPRAGRGPARARCTSATLEERQADRRLVGGGHGDRRDRGLSGHQSREGPRADGRRRGHRAARHRRGGRRPGPPVRARSANNRPNWRSGPPKRRGNRPKRPGNRPSARKSPPNRRGWPKRKPGAIAILRSRLGTLHSRLGILRSRLKIARSTSPMWLASV